MGSLEGSIDYGKMQGIFAYLDAVSILERSKKEHFNPNFIRDVRRYAVRYEESSLFGKNFEQIKQRVRKEIIDSTSLFLLYLEVLAERAESRLSVAKTVPGVPESGPNHVSLKREQMASYDLLRIIN